MLLTLPKHVLIETVDGLQNIYLKAMGLRFILCSEISSYAYIGALTTRSTT